MKQISLVFLDLLKSSVIVQGTITLGVIALWVVMTYQGRPIPTDLQYLTVGLVGFYFGGKFVQLTAASTTTAAGLVAKYNLAVNSPPPPPNGFAYQLVRVDARSRPETDGRIGQPPPGSSETINQT